MNWRLLENSLSVAGGTTLIASFFGLAFAVVSASLPARARTGMLSLALVSFVLPPFLVANTWMNYFGLTGTWRSYLNFDVYSLPGTIMLLSFLLWPIIAVLLSAAFLRADRAYLEQEPHLAGLNLFRYLLGPAARPAFVAGSALTFVLALNNFSIPALLQTKVYAAEVWLSFNTKFDYIEALRLSWPLILAPILLMLILRTRSVRFAFRSEKPAHLLLRSRLGPWFALSATLSALILVCSLFLPLLQLLSSARTWTEFLPAIEAGKNAAKNSLLFAFLPAALVLAAGLFTSHYKAAALSWILFLIPGVLLGIALIWALNRPPIAAFYQSIGIVLLSFGLRYFAIGWSAARAATESLDRGIIETLSLFGAGRAATLRLALWPQSKTLLLGAFYLIYLLCLWEVETLILIVPPGRETLALRIFNMLHYGHASQVDALCVWLLIFALAPLAAFALLNQAGAMVGRGCRRAFLPIAKTVPILLALLVTSCAPASDQSIPLESKFFASVQVIGTRGTGVGQFNKPRSVAVDRSDNLYVVDITGRVQKFSPDGKFLLSWQMPQTDKGKPKGMALDSNGNIIVVEPHYSRVNHFDVSGKLVAQWGQTGTNRGELTFPRSVGVNSRGEVFLTEYGLAERIQHFSAKGEFIDAFGTPGTHPGELNRAEGVGIDKNDLVYEADSCNHRVQIFSPAGQFIGAFGSPGSGPGEMSYPYDVRVDSLGYRFVCEFGNSRVQIFDPQNRSIEIVGGAGAEPGQMNNPWAIAFDSHGNLYVADSGNHRVQKFLRRDPLVTVTPVSPRTIAAAK